MYLNLIKRNAEVPKLSLEQFKQHLGERFKLESEKMALKPAFINCTIATYEKIDDETTR